MQTATVVAGIYNSPAPLYRMEDTEVTPVQVDTPASPARSVASPARSVSSPEPALPARHRPQVSLTLLPPFEVTGKRWSDELSPGSVPTLHHPERLVQEGDRKDSPMM